MDEKRKVERKQTNNYFGIYHRETEKFVGRLFDLSPQGLLMLAKNEMTVNTVYEFRVDLPKPIGGKYNLAFNAECVWCRKSSSSAMGYDAGFKIVDIGFEDITTIQYLLNDSLFMETEEQLHITLMEKVI